MTQNKAEKVNNSLYNSEDLSYLTKKYNQYKKDLYSFGAECVSLTDKQRNYVKFKMNKAQQFMHYRIEKMKRRKGFVKVLILKGRQQGSSKYFNLRLLRSTILDNNQSCYVLAHESKTSGKLFEDIKSMYESVPDIPGLKPKASKDNEKQLVFNDINASIYVGTAQSGEGGRGFTVSRAHGSEVAFWPDLDRTLKGLLQACDGDGTEVYLESTANGMNAFYLMCMNAIKGVGEFELIFVPWWWETAYQKAEIDYDILEDSEDYWRANMRNDFPEYKDAIPYLKWRTAKVYEIKEDGFKQEYPANPIEAFQFSGSRLLDINAVNAARQSNYVERDVFPVVIGVDAAEKGDRTAIVVRRGRQILQYYTWDEMKTTRLTGIIGQLINKYQPVKVFVDKAYGQGAVDNLEDLGYGSIVESVHFGSGANDDRYLNKRAEMHGVCAEWFQNEWQKVQGTDLPIALNIPDKEDFAADILAIPDLELTGPGMLKMKDKREIKKELSGLSPDIWDALILTFAEPVAMIKVGQGAGLRIKTNSPTQSVMKGK